MFTIEVPLDEYHRMRQSSNFLHFLEVCGVNSWEGYGQALMMYEQQMRQDEGEGEG